MNIKLCLGLALGLMASLTACEDSAGEYRFAEDKAVAISGGEGQPDIIVTRSCGTHASVGYTTHERGTFRIIDDSTARPPVWVSSNKKEIVTFSFPLKTKELCYVDIRFESEIEISAVPQSEWELLPEEELVFNQNLARCEAMGQVATRLYTGTILNSVPFLTVYHPEIGPSVIDREFHGCPYIVANYTIGINVENGTESWRIFVSFENIIISRTP